MVSLSKIQHRSFSSPCLGAGLLQTHAVLVPASHQSLPLSIPNCVFSSLFSCCSRFREAVTARKDASSV